MIARRYAQKRDNESEELYDFNLIQPIAKSIPEITYNYVGNGLEPDGNLNMVLVLEDGYDEAALKASDVHPPETLPQRDH